MHSPKSEITLELTPQSRLDLINVNRRIQEHFGGILERYRKTLYYSYHTTAGYFDQRLCERLNHSRDSLRRLVSSFQSLFPPQASYKHDRLQLRTELTEEQRQTEPLNADSHLTYIGSGLANCVTYENRPDKPVYFVDLDGIYGKTRRRRQTTVIGFNTEEVASQFELPIPVSRHPIDSIDLKERQLGLFDQLQHLLDRHEVVHGRIDLCLKPEEWHAGLTVNEYETLLMKHDLKEVLRNPVRFMAEKGMHILGDPGAVPGKALNYAKYDLVRVVNDFLDALGLSESMVERVIDKFLAVPASRFLWMKRGVSLLVSDNSGEGRGRIVEGQYQRPILVQWKKAPAGVREVTVKIVRFQ